MTHDAKGGAALAGCTQEGIDRATRSVRKESMLVESVAHSGAEPLVVVPMPIQQC